LKIAFFFYIGSSILALELRVAEMDMRFRKEFNTHDQIHRPNDKPQLWLFSGTNMTMSGKGIKNAQAPTFG
jgi:hypothetical protein